MPPAKEIPRWKRKAQARTSAGVSLSGRHARAFAREYAREAARLTAGPGTTAAANDTLARTGAWRFRRHMAPFAWIGCLLAGAVLLRRAPHPLICATAAGLIVPLLAALAVRHLSAYAQRTVLAWGILTSAWLPSLVSLGFSPPWPGLLALNWAVCAALWVRHYRWRPAAAQPEAQAVPDTSDAAVWARLAAERKWNGILGPAEELPGGGRRYPVQLDGIKTTIGTVLAASENIAGAWHKPMTEAYAERDPQGITSRGYLTILGRESLMTVREWAGGGIDPLAGTAVIGRYADGADTHVKFYTPRYGTRHALVSGTTGSGKSELLNLLIFIALATTGWFVPVVLDPQEGQSLPFWRDRCLYAAGVDECHRMLRGLHAGMLGRSRYLSGLRWEDDGIAMRGMPFFDYELTRLPMPLIVFDEAHMALKGSTRGEREIVENTVEIGRLGRKTGTGLWLATHIPGLTDLGGEQALRDMLRGGNVVSMRTANRVGGPMLGLDKDPSEIPKFFADGRETYGLGYAAGPDNRPDAPMRSDLVPKAMRRRVPPVPKLDDRFLEAMDAAMGTQGVLLPRPDVPAPEADDMPEGRRCIDAVWQILADAGKPMERGEIIKWVNELVTTGWGRERPFTIRSITSALTALTAGDGGRFVTKVRDGVYAAGGARNGGTS
jgi:Helicase HerA, central domain